jgi:hypothetical protein
LPTAPTFAHKLHSLLPPAVIKTERYKAQAIEVDIRKGALTMRIKWPASAGADFASWAASILK